MDLLYAILDTIFPVNCLSCGKKGSDLCISCLSQAPGAERECAKWIFPLYDYRHPSVRKAVKMLKYRRKMRLAKVFAQALYGRILEELADFLVMENFKDAILIPIPLSSARRRERGFNQSELICKAVLGLDQNKNFKLEKNILFKPKNTVHQAQIENRNQRLKNIMGSFLVKNAELIAGKNIILIDDVVTTGATLSEARKMLKQSGARKVIAFTIAH
jgi:competence protein ComFC